MAITASRLRLVAHQHYDGIGEANAAFPAANPKTQAVHAQVVHKQLADCVCIAWGGKRSIEDLLQTKLVLVKLPPDLLQTSLTEQAGQFLQRHGPHMRG